MEIVKSWTAVFHVDRWTLAQKRRHMIGFFSSLALSTLLYQHTHNHTLSLAFSVCLSFSISISFFYLYGYFIFTEAKQKKMPANPISNKWIKGKNTEMRVRYVCLVQPTRNCTTTTRTTKTDKKKEKMFA